MIWEYWEGGELATWSDESKSWQSQFSQFFLRLAPIVAPKSKLCPYQILKGLSYQALLIFDKEMVRK